MSKEKAWEEWLKLNGLVLIEYKELYGGERKPCLEYLSFYAGYDAAIKDVREMVEKEMLSNHHNKAYYEILEELGRLK